MTEQKADVGSFVEVSPKSINPKAKRYSLEEQQFHCESWRKSGMSMNKYAVGQGITVSSLRAWLNATKNSKLAVIKKSAIPAILPIQVEAGQRLELLLKNGLCLKFSTKSDPAVINQWINSLSCN